MNIGVATTTAQIVANVVGTVKAARELAKDTGNHELKKKIGYAYEGLIDLRERLFALDEENQQLKSELAKKAEIDGPVPPYGYCFDKRNPDSPLCPKCFQAKESCVSFMGPAQEWNRGVRRDCRICGLTIYEKEMDLSPRAR